MSIDDRELRARLEVAVSAAREAGRLTLDYFRRDNYQVQRKADDSPVTEADREAERLLRRRIAEAFPDDAILGEELGEVPGDSGCRWILDPIDGTKSFISGVPLYATLVAAEWDGESVLGVIVIPALDECAYAATGHGAWYRNGDAAPVAARVAEPATLAEGLFVTSEVETFAQRGAADVFHALAERASITRTWGDGYGYLLVATGRAVLMVDPVLNLWDTAALMPVVQEAGGSFTDWQGRPTVHRGEAIACSPSVRDEVLAITRPFA